MPESKTTKNSTPPTEETSPIEAAKLRMARGLSVLSSAIICTGLYTICLCVLISAIFDLMSRVFLSRAAPPDTFGLIAGLAAIGMIIFSLLALICEIRALYEFSKCKIILPQGAPGIIQAVICCLVLGAILSRSPRTFLQESPALSFFSFWSAQTLTVTSCSLAELVVNPGFGEGQVNPSTCLRPNALNCPASTWTAVLNLK